MRLYTLAEVKARREAVHGPIDPAAMQAAREEVQAQIDAYGCSGQDATAGRKDDAQIDAARGRGDA